MINYSIIIPHFRIPEMLRRAVLSVPEREDVEIIVVDDAIGDSYKPEIESACMPRSRQVRIVYLSENGGGGKARNEGLKIANGKWVVFLDADDMFNYCISEAMDEYKDSDEDIVFFRANSIDNETYMPLNRADATNSCLEKALKNELGAEYGLRYYHDVPWAKFFSSRMLQEHDIWFEEIRKHNDVRFAYTTGYYAKKIKVDSRAVYCITSRSDSVSADISADARLLRAAVVAHSIEFRLEHGVDVDESSYNMLFDTMAEIREKDRSVFEKGLQMLRQSSIDKVLIEKRLKRSLRNAKARRLLPAGVRRVIKSLLRVK